MSGASRHQLIQTFASENTVRIHSASDEGAAAFRVQPTSPNCCFPSVEFKVLLTARQDNLFQITIWCPHKD